MSNSPTTTFRRVRGDSTTLDIYAVNPVTGIAFDLSAMVGVIFTAKLAKTDADVDAVFQKSLAAGITVAADVATVEVTYLDSEDLPSTPTTLYCDLQAQDGSGNVSTVWEGTIIFRGDITRGVSTVIPIYTLQPVAAGFSVRTDIIALTGGAATALDGIETRTGSLTVISTGTVVLLTYNRVAQWWQLVDGTDAEAPTQGVVRPDDYNAITNARVWVQL